MAKVITDEKLIDEALTRGVEEVIEKDHLKKAMLSGRQLRVKFGIDPTSPDLHLGHAVALRKLKQFEDLGHKIVLIIGDFTARVGDPTGRSETRKPLTEKEIKLNLKEYLKQAGKILNIRRAEVNYNSKWLAKENMEKIFQLASAGTFQQMMKRADFKKRVDEGGDISVVELLYPLMQGYDSVKVKADVELGGSDQLFNLLMGRKVQRHFGQPEQDILTVPLLVGLDGVKKMSKSYGNYVGLDDEATDMFGKVMSLPDALIENYLLLCTGLVSDEIKNIMKLPPRDAKVRLGKEITSIYHGEKDAGKAVENFEKIFSKKEIPEDAPELILFGKEISAVDLVLLSGVAESKSEAKRLIEQGALEVGGRVEKDIHAMLTPQNGDAVRIGKKYFARIKSAE